MPTADEYRDCLEQMYGLQRFGIKLGLDTIGHTLARLGEPQRGYRCIHIAGTNGKGSVASALAALLQSAGLRTGLFTSPHLVRFNERIRIDGLPISDEEVVARYRASAAAAADGPRPLTFFELCTAMALDAFARRQVDWAVVETGMGGRLDATNIVTPAVSVITNIGLEHTFYLGKRLADIAAEKAGIIKAGVPVVTAVRQPAARAVVQAVAAGRKAPLYRLGHAFRVRRNGSDEFSFYGRQHTWRGLRSRLAGRYQASNWALALAAGELLHDAGVRLDQKRVERALEQQHWPGRLEVVHRRPTILLDGAHNLAAVRELTHHLHSRLADRPITLVTGILDDKPYRAMLAALVPLCRRVIVTRAAIARSLAPETLAAVCRHLGVRAATAPDVPAALRRALAEAGPEEAVVVAGSLYIVGEAIQALAATAAQPDLTSPAESTNRGPILRP